MTEACCRYVVFRKPQPSFRMTKVTLTTRKAMCCYGACLICLLATMTYCLWRAATARGQLPLHLVPLVAKLRSPRGADRLQAARAAAEMGPECAPLLPYLVPLLDDPDDSVRRAVIEGVGRSLPVSAEHILAEF